MIKGQEGGGRASGVSGGSGCELAWKGRRLPVGERTLIMGVLNVTPDSFFDGGRYLDPRLAVRRGLEMAEEGADIIDVGGESTRPGSRPVDLEEEMRRVLPVVGELHRLLPTVPLTIDTTKASVAEEALAAGAWAVNDISGLQFDPAMASTVARLGGGLVVMHIQNRPLSMQDAPSYQDVVAEVRTFLASALRRATESGVPLSATVVDPGIGFGKDLDHNLALLGGLRGLHELGRPVLVGASRKSFIGRILGAELEQRLEGSLASAVSAVFLGAHLVRVHDVRASVAALRVADAIRLGRAPAERGAPVLPGAGGDLV